MFLVDIDELYVASVATRLFHFIYERSEHLHAAYLFLYTGLRRVLSEGARRGEDFFTVVGHWPYVRLHCRNVL